MASPIIPHPFNLMDRLAYYDRNLLPVAYVYGAILAAHPDTERWRYTVPANRKAISGCISAFMGTDIATAGDTTQMAFQLSTNGGITWTRFAYFVHWFGKGWGTMDSITLIFAMRAGDIVRMLTFSNDTVNHGFAGSQIFSEFDA